jgi:membrane protein DedA with SNARE-associated domain
VYRKFGSTIVKMNGNLEELIMTYGYLAVFLGSLVEGESIILIASMLAYSGYLSIYKVLLVAFLGSTISDQGLFLCGRRWGDALLQKLATRWPKILAGRDKAMALMSKFELLFLFSFRFIYGIRIISPILLGIYGISKKRFFLFNIAAAFLWATISCGIGYYFGSFLMALDPLYRFLVIGAIGFVFMGSIAWKIVKLYKSLK